MLLRSGVMESTTDTQKYLIKAIEAAYGLRTSEAISQFVHESLVCMPEADWISAHLRIKRWQDIPNRLIDELELSEMSPEAFRFFLPRLLTIAVESNDINCVTDVCMKLCFYRQKDRLKEFYGFIAQPQLGVVLSVLEFLINRMREFKVYDVRSDLQFLRSFLAKQTL